MLRLKYKLLERVIPKRWRKVRGCDLIYPPKLHRTKPNLLLEKPREMLRIFEAQFVGDFIDSFVAFNYFGYFYGFVQEVVFGRLSRFFLD